MKRPFAVTLLAIIAALAGIWGIIDALRLFGILPIASLGDIQFFSVNWLGAILAIIIALIWFWAASKLWNLDPQGWLFVVVIAVVYLVFDVLALIGGSSWQAVSVSVIVSVVALILGLLPSTRAAFVQS